MRVLHLLHSLRRGGLERVVVSVANGLARRGMPQALCCLHEAGPLVTALDAAVEVFVLDARPNDPTLTPKIRRTVTAFGPTVIDSADFCSWPEATLAAMTCRGVRRSRVFHGFVDRPPWRWRVAGNMLARWTHSLRAVGWELAQQVSDAYRIDRERIEVLPNGVDTDRFDPDSLESADSRIERDVGRFTCVTVASMSEAKNPLLLLDVARELGPGVHFVWVGDGPLRTEFIRAIAERGLDDSFTLVGSVEDVRPYLSAADLFLLPSRTEASPLCAIEAMAMRLPVVATRTGDLTRVVGKSGAGILVNPGDAPAMADAVQRLQRAPEERRLMGVAGRNEVLRRYSLARMLDAYQRSYCATCVRRTAANMAPAVPVTGGR